MKKSAGFSLLEILISSSIILVLMISTMQFFSSSLASHSNVESNAKRFQKAEVATSILSYELGLAGYKGVTLDWESRSIPNPLTISTNSAGSDVLEISYFEDRFEAAPVQYLAKYLVTKKGLERQLNMGTSILVLAGVKKLKVNHLLKNNGTKAALSISTTSDTVGLELAIEFTDGTKTDFIAIIVNDVTTKVQSYCNCQ
jgi:type II secretory pathway pseudopilin PulG